MTGGFDTRVDGSPTSVHAAATWLRTTVKGALESAADNAVSARNAAMYEFSGESGEAYVGLVTTVVTQLDEHAGHADRAATLYDAYGDRLQLCLDRMSAFRAAASAAGLTVTGTVVHAPPPAHPVPPMIGPVSTEQQAAYDQKVLDYQAAVGKVTIYDLLLTDAENEVTSLVEWVETNLTSQLESFDSPDVNKLLHLLKQNAATLGVAIAVESGKEGLKALREKLRKDAEELRNLRRSGNPAKRALGEAPETRERIRGLFDESKLLHKGGKLLGPAGAVYDTYEALESDKPGGGLIAVTVGAVGSGLVVAALPVAVPTAGVVAAGVVVGVGVSAGTSWLWDQAPDDVTDPVDETVGNAWDSVKDHSQDAVSGYLQISGFR